MIKGFRNILILIGIILFNSNCNGQNFKEEKAIQEEKVKVLIPFLPGDCHQCNEGFYKNLKALDAKKIEYSFLIPDEFSDDLDYIKKEYKLESYNNQRFIHSTVLFEKYHIFQQSFVLQSGLDSNYRAYDNATALISDYELFGKEDKLTFGSYKVKGSTANIIIKNKENFYFQNSVQTSSFDYLDLKDQKKSAKIPFTEKQLLNNYVLFFRDSSIAKSKLNEIKNITDIPNKDKFEQFELIKDTLFVSSYHTYIANIADSMLGGFLAINVYKDGNYLSSRAVNSKLMPKEYTIIPKFHIYRNALYVIAVKNQMETNKPNNFLAKFEFENGEYQFRKLLNFTIPPINNEVGYQYLELKFSDQFCMTSISNVLYDLEAEQSVALNIPTNDAIGFADLMNNLKGVNIVIKDIETQYPNLLISYFSKDRKGAVINKVLNYNLVLKNVTGKFQIPEDNSRYFKPDHSKFGYFFWMPEKNNNDYLVYKKLF